MTQGSESKTQHRRSTSPAFISTSSPAKQASVIWKKDLYYVVVPILQMGGSFARMYDEVEFFLQLDE